jgi:hypothetical protein
MNRGTPQQTSPEKPPVKAPSNQPVENEGRAESELAFRRIDDTVNNIAAADDTRNSESRPIPQFLPESNADVIRGRFKIKICCFIDNVINNLTLIFFFSFTE